jgi:hypothetical protein
MGLECYVAMEPIRARDEGGQTSVWLHGYNQWLLPRSGVGATVTSCYHRGQGRNDSSMGYVGFGPSSPLPPALFHSSPSQPLHAPSDFGGSGSCGAGNMPIYFVRTTAD